MNKPKLNYTKQIGIVWAWITGIWIGALACVMITWFVATLEWDNSVAVVWQWFTGNGAAFIRVVLFLTYVAGTIISFLDTKSVNRRGGRRSTGGW